MDERIKIIADHYGMEHQLNKLEEEFEELIQAMEGTDVTNLMEEIVDVGILLQQLEYLGVISQGNPPAWVSQIKFLVIGLKSKHAFSEAEMDMVYNFKLNRTIRRMGEE